MTPEAIQRRRERRKQKHWEEMARYNASIAILRSKEMSCSNCEHYGARPVGEKRRICDLHSDFYGYVFVKPNSVCPDHKSRVTEPTLQKIECSKCGDMHLPAQSHVCKCTRCGKAHFSHHVHTCVFLEESASE